MGFFKKFITGKDAPPRGKQGARAYAVGDIHGRLDLVNELLEQIEDDVASRLRRRTWVVFLGDYVDRGPDSAGVIERLRKWRPEHLRPVFLSGNHEEVFLSILGGDARFLGSWLKFGGAECAASYGVDPDVLRRIDEEEAVALLQANVPPAHREFLEGLGDTFSFGDYLFVHAGIRPGIAVEEQDPTDLRWIRDPFLSDNQDHGCVVVHGHTIFQAVDERENRIGIDTGAYRTGILTALAVEEERRWYLATAERPFRKAPGE